MRPLWPVRTRLRLWLLLEALVLLWVATHTGNDFMRKLGHLDYALEVALFAAAATLAAMMALRVAIPGRRTGPREVALAVVLVLIGTALVMVGEPVRTGYPLGEFLHVGHRLRPCRPACSPRCRGWRSGGRSSGALRCAAPPPED